MIPTGVAHGFLALEPLELLYLVTNEYDGTDELGFAWDDPTAGVPLARRRRDRRRAPDPLRPRPDRTRRWPTSWCACATGDMTGRTPSAPPPHRTARDRTGPPRWAYEAAGPSRDCRDRARHEPEDLIDSIPVAWSRPFAQTRRHPRPRHARRAGRVRARPPARPLPAGARRS